MKKHRTKRGSKPGKKKGARLGQHFLTAQWAAALLAQSAHIQQGTPVLEIGPGTGNLTKELLRCGAQVTAIEKDPLLVETLKTRFPRETQSGQLTIVSEDIRNVDPETLGYETNRYVVAANIPYYITGEIMRMFLSSNIQPLHMALLVQKEVAERIAREKKESILSLSVKIFGTPRYIKTVSRGCFAPPPSVDSAILLIENISRNNLPEKSEGRFFEIVKKGFGSKRKMLGGNLKTLFSSEELKACGVNPHVRAENVPLEKWILLSSLQKSNGVLTTK